MRTIVKTLVIITITKTIIKVTLRIMCKILKLTILKNDSIIVIMLTITFLIKTTFKTKKYNILPIKVIRSIHQNNNLINNQEDNNTKEIRKIRIRIRVKTETKYNTITMIEEHATIKMLSQIIRFPAAAMIEQISLIKENPLIPGSKLTCSLIQARNLRRKITKKEVILVRNH